MMSSIGLSVLLVAAIGVQQPSPTTQTPQPVTAPQPAPDLPSCPELAQALNAVVRNDARLKDWAFMARYREDNAKLGKPAAGEARVVFMGDSITDSWQQPRFGGFFPGKPYVDRGISGQTTPQMLVRFRRDVIELQPKVVVILAGTNDIAGNTGTMSDEDIEANLASMSDLAHAHGIRVVFSSILPVSAYHTAANGIPQTTLRPMARIRAVNDWLKNYAAAHADVYLDYGAAMSDASGVLRAELSADDLHPNAAGYAIMAPLAEDAIQRALK
jgi:lysophospholipase L1-like esterase